MLCAFTAPLDSFKTGDDAAATDDVRPPPPTLPLPTPSTPNSSSTTAS